MIFLTPFTHTSYHDVHAIFYLWYSSIFFNPRKLIKCWSHMKYSLTSVYRTSDPSIISYADNKRLLQYQSATNATCNFCYSNFALIEHFIPCLSVYQQLVFVERRFDHLMWTISINKRIITRVKWCNDEELGRHT